MHKVVQPINLHLSGRGNCACNNTPHRVEIALILLPVGLTYFICNKHLACRFVLAVADKLHIHACPIQAILQKEEICAYSAYHNSAVAVHIDLICHRGNIVR